MLGIIVYTKNNNRIAAFEIDSACVETSDQLQFFCIDITIKIEIYSVNLCCTMFVIMTLSATNYLVWCRRFRTML